MNIKNILPKEIWTDHGPKQATMLSLSNFSEYHFDGGEGKVTYNLIGTKVGGDGVEAADTLFTGTIQIPAEVISQWGESDQIIWSYVSSALSITFA